MSGASYLRCKHCRGFYETSFARCKWCEYDAPFPDVAGRPRVFPDRETCRAIQVAEYDQLPPEALEDCMGPPKQDLSLLCNCLHCGPEGHRFEAVEMRWMANERMWACPCTTCGGRGFGIDVHSAEDKWQCADCGHFYLPENGDHRAENAKCPKCGSTEASGWFDDGYDEDDFDEDFDDDDDDDDPAERKAGVDTEENDEPGFDIEDFDRASAARRAGEDAEIPWDEEDEKEGPEYDLGISWRESDDDAEEDGELFSSGGEERLPDDIDFPRDAGERDSGFNENDIPF